MREWLPEDHLAWLVLDAVAELDLHAFYAAYRREWRRARLGGRGRPIDAPGIDGRRFMRAAKWGTVCVPVASSGRERALGVPR